MLSDASELHPTYRHRRTTFRPTPLPCFLLNCQAHSQYHPHPNGQRPTGSCFHQPKPTPKNQMRSCETDFGQSYANRKDLLLLLLIGSPQVASRSRADSCSVVWGFGVLRTGPWARPRPGALGGPLVMPRKPWSGPVLPPPKFPGVMAMESILPS
jgi:hypothetical protein